LRAVPLTEITAPKVVLTEGQDYYAKLVLTGLEEAFGSAGAVKEKFTGLGFSDVTVWAKRPPPELAFDQPTANGATYYARGVWSKATETLALPAQVTRAWRDDAGPEAAPGAANPALSSSHPADDASRLRTAMADAASPSPNWGFIALLALALLSRES